MVKVTHKAIVPKTSRKDKLKSYEFMVICINKKNILVNCSKCTKKHCKITAIQFI